MDEASDDGEEPSSPPRTEAPRVARLPSTTFTVSIRVAGISSTLDAPHFRFALPFGSGAKPTRVTTGSIPSWARVASMDASGASGGSSASSRPADEVDDASGPSVAADPSADDASDSDAAAPAADAAVYEWRETYEHAVDREWAIGVNEQPFVLVHLADAAHGVLGHVRLDLSPLLISGSAAATREEGRVGDHFRAIAALRAEGVGTASAALDAGAVARGGSAVTASLVAGLVGPGGPFAEPKIVRGGLLRQVVVRVATNQAALPPQLQFELNPMMVTLSRSLPLPAPPSAAVATHNDAAAAAAAAQGTLDLRVESALVEYSTAPKDEMLCCVAVSYGMRSSFRTTPVAASAASSSPAAAVEDEAASEGEADDGDASSPVAIGYSRPEEKVLRTHTFAPLAESDAGKLAVAFGDAATPESLVVLVELFAVASARGGRKMMRGGASPSASSSSLGSPRGFVAQSTRMASATVSLVDWINRGVACETIRLDIEASFPGTLASACVRVRSAWSSPLIYGAFHLPLQGMVPAALAEKGATQPRLSQAPRWTSGVAVSLDARNKNWFASWTHSMCILTGPDVVDQLMIRKYFDSAAVQITLHDRDMGETAEAQDAQSERWNALVAAAAKGDGVWEALETVRVEEEAEATHGCMGTKHPHGSATVRLTELLLRNREIAKGFDRTRATLRRKRAAAVAAAAAAAAAVGEEDADTWTDVAEEAAEDDAYLLELSSEAALDASVVPRRARSSERLSEKVELRVPAPPGCYLESSTSIVGVARLFRSVDAALLPFKSAPQPAFERMIISFMYNNTALLSTILRVVREVNQAALPSVSLRSYQLSDDERRAANAGELDIIGGFMICDAERRFVVLEGISASGIRALNAALPRAIANDASTHFLRDPTIRFTNRIYTSFEVDIKVIRLRTTLYSVLAMPRNYNTNNVDADLFSALHSMLNAQKARTMREVCAANLFPSAHALAEVESKYGETVTLLDMGIVHNKRRRDFTLSGKYTEFAAVAASELDSTCLRLSSRVGDNNESRPNTGAGVTFSGAAGGGGPATMGVGGDETGSGDALSKLAAKISGVSKAASIFKKSTAKPAGHSTRRKAATDANNAEFEEYLRERKHQVIPDRIGDAARRSSALKAAARETMVEKQRIAEKQWEEEGPYYQYSGQRLRTLDAEKEKMRQRIAKDLGATYTYSQAGDFVSLTVSRYDPDSIERIQAKEARQLWTTKRGFVYPPPRRPEEYAKHPKDVSATRKEDLREPWIENESNGGPSAQAQRGTGIDPSIVQLHGLSDFDSVPCKGYDFGPKEMFETVFVGGEQLRRAEAVARQHEIDAWNQKVVVDTLTMVSHVPTKHPNRQDNMMGIRRGPPKTVALRGGKSGPIKQFPVSISMQEECVNLLSPHESLSPPPSLVWLFHSSCYIYYPSCSKLLSRSPYVRACVCFLSFLFLPFNRYVDPVDFTTKMRQKDPEKMAAAGHTDAFERHIHSATYQPKHQTMMYHHSHYAVDPERQTAARATVRFSSCSL